MFLSYYGLREQPFGVTPDPHFLYETAVHREALASLLYGIESGTGFTALLAPPGMGKTTLLFHLLERYRHAAESAFIFDTQCNSHELLQALFSEFELDAVGTDAELHARFKEYLSSKAQAGRRVLVLIDEAQNLDMKVLETVRLLSNFETPRQKLLHIILSGQPQLEADLARPEMLQLRQRITLFTRLAPFSPEDTGAYIEHRLKVAGYGGTPLFTPNALAMIMAESHGVPREINRMCFNAMSLGFALQKRTIDAEVLYEVVNDLRPRDWAMHQAAWHESVGAEHNEEKSAVPPGVQKSPNLRKGKNSPSLPEPSPSPSTHCELSDPFAPRQRHAVTAEQGPPSPQPREETLQPHVVRPAPEPAAHKAVVDQAVSRPAPGASAHAKAQQHEEQTETAPPSEDLAELTRSIETDPTIAVQRALLDVALKSHRKASYVPLAGLALGIPLVLWILAYLIFRFDIVTLIRQ